MGLKYKHEAFGERNAVESFFSLLKERTKSTWSMFPFKSPFDSVQRLLKSFVMLYNLERCNLGSALFSAVIVLFQKEYLLYMLFQHE